LETENEKGAKFCAPKNSKKIHGMAEVGYGDTLDIQALIAKTQKHSNLRTETIHKIQNKPINLFFRADSKYMPLMG